MKDMWALRDEAEGIVRSKETPSIDEMKELFDLVDRGKKFDSIYTAFLFGYARGMRRQKRLQKQKG